MCTINRSPLVRVILKPSIFPLNRQQPNSTNPTAYRHIEPVCVLLPSCPLAVAAYSCATEGSLYWSKSMQREYNKRHAGQPNKVQLNDAVFALHATFVSFLTLAQVRRRRAARRATVLTLFSWPRVAHRSKLSYCVSWDWFCNSLVGRTIKVSGAGKNAPLLKSGGKAVARKGSVNGMGLVAMQSHGVVACTPRRAPRPETCLPFLLCSTTTTTTSTTTTTTTGGVLRLAGA